MDEAKISAIVVSILTGIGLTLVLTEALRSLSFALSISVPITLVMAGALALFASDNIKKAGSADPRGKKPDAGSREGN